MSDEKSEIKIQIDDEKPAQPELDLVIEKVEDEKGDSKHEISTEDAIADLNRKLDAERKARIEAENRAHEASQEVRRANNTVEDTNLHLVTNAISLVKRDAEIYKSNYRAAMENGDYGAAAEAQEGMANMSARLLQLENGKSALEAKPREAIEQPRRDPVEAFASQLSPRSATWVRNNPQCVTDPRMNQKMIAAHNFAMADGYEADSDDYFNFVETTLGMRKRVEAAPEEEVMSTAASSTQRRSSPPAAPVSRSNNTNGTRPNVVRLSAAEREMADNMGMKPEEYAKNKLALQKEGKLH